MPSRRLVKDRPNRVEEQKINELLDDAELQRMLEEAADPNLFGFSTDPNDSIWIGEDGNLDPDEWLSEHLGPKHPLENVLIPITEANNDVSGLDERKKEGLVRLKLNGALKALVGHQLKDGPVDKDWPILVEVASELWHRHISGGSVVFAKVAREVLNKRGRTDKLDGRTDPKSYIDRLGNKFAKNQDILMGLVSSTNTPEQAERRRKEQEVLALLEQLGVKVTTSSD